MNAEHTNTVHTRDLRPGDHVRFASERFHRFNGQRAVVIRANSRDGSVIVQTARDGRRWCFGPDLFVRVDEEQDEQAHDQ